MTGIFTYVKSLSLNPSALETSSVSLLLFARPFVISSSSRSPHFHIAQVHYQFITVQIQGFKPHFLRAKIRMSASFICSSLLLSVNQSEVKIATSFLLCSAACRTFHRKRSNGSPFCLQHCTKALPARLLLSVRHYLSRGSLSYSR